MSRFYHDYMLVGHKHHAYIIMISDFSTSFCMSYQGCPHQHPALGTIQNLPTLNINRVWSRLPLVCFLYVFEVSPPPNVLTFKSSPPPPNYCESIAYLTIFKVHKILCIPKESKIKVFHDLNPLFIISFKDGSIYLRFPK